MPHMHSLVAVLVVASAMCVACDPGGAREAVAKERPSALVVSAAPDSVTQHAILAARDAIWRAWFANDTTQLGVLLPEAVAAGESDGSDQRWADRLQTVREARQFVASGGKLVRLDFPQTEIRISGDVAMVFSTFTFETAVRGATHTTSGRSAEVFVRRNGRWVNPFWHLGT